MLCCCLHNNEVLLFPPLQASVYKRTLANQDINKTTKNAFWERQIVCYYINLYYVSFS